ncbi:MAG: response regulator [Gammaproteobacteria bacterium]|nr:response regulator [Gammaproteobacteria bacterium]
MPIEGTRTRIGNARRPLVLVAEDDPLDRRFIDAAWHEVGSGVELRFVEDGVQLVDSLREETADGQRLPKRLDDLPRLILLDLNMPRMDGHEVLRDIKSDPTLKRIPVVVLSTSSNERDIARAYAAGANSYIIKPMTYEELVKAIEGLNSYWFDLVQLPIRGDSQAR